jgi:hypothetical protein
MDDESEIIWKETVMPRGTEENYEKLSLPAKSKIEQLPD